MPTQRQKLEIEEFGMCEVENSENFPIINSFWEAKVSTNIFSKIFKKSASIKNVLGREEEQVVYFWGHVLSCFSWYVTTFSLLLVAVHGCSNGLGDGEEREYVGSDAFACLHSRVLGIGASATGHSMKEI